jgi:Holliday junction resolvasome RuvABC endonuclease subunit
MNLMSIDPSKRSLGLYVIANKHPFSETIKSERKEEDVEIYNKLKCQLEGIVSYCKIELIFLEDYAFSRFGKSRASSSLAEITGIIKMLAYSQGCKIITVPISTWKSFFHGLPVKKDKKYVEFVNKWYNKGIVFNTADECDAFMIMQAMHYIYRGICKSESQLNLRNKMLKIGEIF